MYVFTQEATSLFNPAEFAPFDPTQEVIFPPELMVNSHKPKHTIKHNHVGVILGKKTKYLL